MSKAAMIRARIEPELKTEVENLFRQLGLTATEAITLFYRQVRLNRGLPFPVRIPHPSRDTDAGQNIVQRQDAAELLERLDLDDPLLGMFAQEPDLMDSAVAAAMCARETDPLRLPAG